jgi:DNA-directed RNA polymerase specialized sigma24 family protein
MSQEDQTPEMFMLRKNRRKQEKALEYATRSDFQQIFTEDMAGLHLLALLLTADPDRAEDCLVAGLEESANSNTVFKHWARSWSKRAIIKNAIKALRPVPGKSSQAPDAALWNGTWDFGAEGGKPVQEDLVTAVTRLDVFERFVFVMAVLEGYSVAECAVLLACPPKEAARARSLALQHLASPPTTAPLVHDDEAMVWTELVSWTQPA